MHAHSPGDGAAAAVSQAALDDAFARLTATREQLDAALKTQRSNMSKSGIRAANTAIGDALYAQGDFPCARLLFLFKIITNS